MQLLWSGLQRRYNELVAIVKADSNGAIDFDKLYADKAISFGSRNRNDTDVAGTFFGADDSNLIDTITYYVPQRGENESEEEFNARVAEFNSKTKDVIDAYVKTSDTALDNVATLTMIGAELERQLATSYSTLASGLNMFGGVADEADDTRER